MSIQIVCTNPSCHQPSEFPASSGGRKVICDHCGHEMVLPDGKRLDGLILDNYGLLCRVGVGAMGQVYEGRDMATGQRIAIKVFHQDLAADTVMIGRFEREARVAVTLKHPYIVEGYAAGQDAGQTYIAMEFMDGENALERLRRKGSLPPKDAIAIAASVADALAHARRYGIVHRDVKPANILTNSQGMIKLADLGIVRVEDSQTMLTMSDNMTGTPLYMAPEHCLDPKSADLRSDIYSLGVTFLFLLTGKHPFKRDSLLQVLRAHEQDPLPRGAELGVELPAEIDAIAQKMAAKNPAQRYQDYDTLCAALHDAHDRL
jgi:eukaryotic-like serine/threonine-protein kinase